MRTATISRLTGFANELVGMNLPVIVNLWDGGCACVAGSDQDHAHRRRGGGRFGRRRDRCEPGAPRRQYHGLSVIDVDISGKQLELLKDFSPTLSRVAVLLKPRQCRQPCGVEAC